MRDPFRIYYKDCTNNFEIFDPKVNFGYFISFSLFLVYSLLFISLFITVKIMNKLKLNYEPLKNVSIDNFDIV